MKLNQKQAADERHLRATTRPGPLPQSIDRRQLLGQESVEVAGFDQQTAHFTRNDHDPGSRDSRVSIYDLRSNF